jgi:hypothetical protein
MTKICNRAQSLLPDFFDVQTTNNTFYKRNNVLLFFFISDGIKIRPAVRIDDETGTGERWLFSENMRCPGDPGKGMNGEPTEGG